ncbi:MAG: thymidylate synthase, partial [Nitrososphaerales archaeon]
MWEEKYIGTIEEILSRGTSIHPSRGNALQLIAHQLTLDDPRDRILFNAIRSWNLAQALGHFLWMIAGRSDLRSIQFYNKHAANFSSDGEKLIGAYGPRMAGTGTRDQINYVVNLLQERPDTRRAVITIYSPDLDHHDLKDEVPCAMDIQFISMDNRLHAISHMRSQEALFMMPYDIFFFTLLHEYIAARADLRCGSYTHFCNSIHIYEKDTDFANAVKRNGVETLRMPIMPIVSAKDSLASLLAIEEEIRTEATFKKKVDVPSILE